MEATETNRNSKKRKRPKVWVDGSVLHNDFSGDEYCDVDNSIDEGDYDIMDQIYQDHLRFVRQSDDGHDVEEFESMYRVRKDSNRRIYHVQLPEMYCLPGILLQLDALEILDLTNSPSIKIPRWFGQLMSLKQLFITLDEGTSLPEQILDLSNLEVLRVDGTRHASIPSSIRKLTNLRELHIALDRLQDDAGDCSTRLSLPNTIGSLTSLKEMSIFVDNLPDEIVELTNLEVLRVGSDLVSLPSFIGRLTNLKEFYYLEGDKLNCLPSEIGDLSALEILDLSDSMITSIPCSVSKLTNLKDLNLSGTEKLRSLPDEIGDLTSLETLRLGLGIRSLPSSVGNLKNLKVLHFKDCIHLKGLPDETGNLTSLEVLDLLGAKSITSLPLSVGNLTNLKTLNLRNTFALSRLPEEIRNLKNLQVLYLGPKFLQRNSSVEVQWKLARDCPRLGCLGYGYNTPRPCPLFVAHALMRNRANSRLGCYRNEKGRESSIRLSMWTLILKNANRAFSPYPVEEGCCRCCRKRFKQVDARFQLLVNYGATIFETRKVALEAS
jgi:Leucine-rich repeat (LRR) protein